MNEEFKHEQVLTDYGDIDIKATFSRIYTSQPIFLQEMLKISSWA